MFWKKYIKPYQWPAIIGFFFKMCEALLELCVPLVVASIIDKGVSKGNNHYITQMAFVLFGLAVCGYLCALVCQYFASLTSQGCGTLMRKDMFRAINAYDYENLDEIGTPSLITRLTNDVNQLQVSIAMTIRLASRSPFLIIGSLVMSFMINAKIAMIFLIISPLIALSIYIVMSLSEPIYVRVQKLLDQVSLITRENLSGVRVIRAFNKQPIEKKRFHKATKRQKEQQITAGNISILMNPATTVIVNTGIILILYQGSFKINTGTLTQGEIIALINYMNQILLSMYAFANVIIGYVKSAACAKRIKQVLSIEPAIQEGKKAAPLQYDSMISFDDVSFTYKEGHALAHLSFDIKPHTTIGIIGGTGAGKSTLVHLIPRFYDATSGRITIKGQSIKDYTFSSLREMIGFVPQSATLFSGTIRDNLLWGNAQATNQELEEALALSQGAEFVHKCEKGLETRIEQSGKNVSGGQRQRLTIARALVKKPEILILDDSASALDFATDAALRKAIATLPCTTLIVSQRVSALMHADQIIVLTHGEMAGMGTHQELMKTCALYQEIVHSQLEGDEA